MLARVAVAGRHRVRRGRRARRTRRTCTDRLSATSRIRPARSFLARLSRRLTPARTSRVKSSPTRPAHTRFPTSRPARIRLSSRCRVPDLHRARRHRHQPRRARRRAAGPRHARGGVDRHGDGRDSPDRKRRRAAHREQRAAADAADQRPRVPELHDADARRRRSELSAVGRHQQSRAHDVADHQRPAGDQYGRPARRHHGDQSVLREHPELRPQPRGDRDGQRRHEQLRRRSGHGGRGGGQRAGEDRHEQFPRLGVRIRHRRAVAGAQLLPARRSRQRARRA